MNLDFEKYSDNLIPTIVQDSRSGEVLMLGFSSAESFEQTKKTRKATFFSRSRQEMWEKGSTSGNTFNITSITYDCDADSLLYRCLPAGPACHTGKESCFFEGEEGKTDAEILWSVYNTVLARKKEAPEGSYVASLYADGLDRIAQKVGEEAVETVIAAKNDDVDEFVGEFSDLLFHMMVLLAEKDVSLTSIVQKFHDRIK